jgi:excisionase family DNA binding protein
MPVRPRSADDLRALGAWAKVEEVAAFLGCSRAQLYTDIDAGRVPFPVVRVGRKLRVPTAPVLALFGVETNGHLAPGDSPAGTSSSAAMPPAVETTEGGAPLTALGLGSVQPRLERGSSGNHSNRTGGV